MITKEQIEAMRAEWQSEADKKGKEPEAHLQYCRNMVEAFDLALLAVALKPRPLAEIEGDQALVMWGNARFSYAAKSPNGEWKESVFHDALPDTTLAIPLSAIAGLMESPAHDQ